MADLMVAVPSARIAPYVFAGPGVQTFHTTSGTSTVLAVRGGVGAAIRVRRRRLVVETSSVYAFTSRGTNDDVWAVNYRPVSLGLTF